VPKDKTVEGQQFEVRLHEVERTCESIIREACSKVLWYEVIEQRYVHFYARDDNRNPVDNVRCECAGETVYTGSDGKSYLVLDTEATYYARGYAPSGYECTDCYESFYHDSDRIVNFYMKKKPTTVTVNVSVVDQDSVPVVNSQVTIPNALGATTISTNASGVAVGFTLTKGAAATATAAPPTGYTSDSGSTRSFTASQSGTIDLTLTKKPTTGTLRVRAYNELTDVYLFNVAVYVDFIYRGVTLGHTGLTILSVPFGFHTVELIATGYSTKTVTPYVAGDTLVDTGMTPYGKLAVGSTPHGARIYVDGVDHGTTYDPSSPSGQYKYIPLPAGTYSVKLTLDGYKDATVTAQVGAGQTTYYSPVLEALTGDVYVTGELSDGTALTGAEIYVDDVATGVLTPGTVTTSVGSHTIVAKKDV